MAGERRTHAASIAFTGTRLQLVCILTAGIAIDCVLAVKELHRWCSVQRPFIEMEKLCCGDNHP